ncbi:unnamed protein product [Calypogeia fissa]
MGFLHYHNGLMGTVNGKFFPRFSLLLLLVVLTISAPATGEEEAVQRFRQFLQIDTAQPGPDYSIATKFLKEQGKELGLEVQSLEFTPKKPVVLLTWEGSDLTLPSILLNSHSDVVPADESQWLHAPFSAHVDEDGKIFARGSQDMKCVGMQYLEAIRNLKSAGFKPQRSLHVSFVPDEEIGGDDGAEKFVKSDVFKKLNVAAVMDEGLASTEDEYRVFYGERTVWWFVIKASGSPAHGSRMFDGTALQNLRESLNKIDEFRTVQFDKVKSGEVAEGEVVSINNVFLKAGTPTPTGFVMNLQPSEAEAGFDMRLPPIVDTDFLQKLLEEEWAPASRNLTIKFIQKRDVNNKYGKPAVTLMDDSNPWWTKFKVGVAKAGGKLAKPEIFMASTDARFVRFEGIPAFGFSPMSNTPILLHDHNEFLHVKEYLRGIKVYEEIIKSFTGPESEVDTADSASSPVLHEEL